MLDQLDNPKLNGGFNLLLNPFVVLGVAPNATAQEIKQAYEDALEDGVASAEVLQRAQQSLLNPRLRVDAELGGLLDVALPLARELIAKLREGASRSELADTLRSLHALPKSNILAHLGSTSPLDVAELLELLELQATIAVGAVHDAVTDAREGAGSGKKKVGSGPEWWCSSAEAKPLASAPPIAL